MCGPDGGKPDPRVAQRHQGRTGRGAIGAARDPLNTAGVLDKAATAAAERAAPRGGRTAHYRNLNVYQKDEQGRAKLKDGFMYSDAEGIDNGKTTDIWKLGVNGERPGDPVGGRQAEAPQQAQSSRSTGNSATGMRKRNRRATVMTGSRGLDGPARASAKTLLGE